METQSGQDFQSHLQNEARKSTRQNRKDGSLAAGQLHAGDDKPMPGWAMKADERTMLPFKKKKFHREERRLAKLSHTVKNKGDTYDKSSWSQIRLETQPPRGGTQSVSWGGSVAMPNSYLERKRETKDRRRLGLDAKQLCQVREGTKAAKQRKEENVVRGGFSHGINKKTANRADPERTPNMMMGR